MRSHWIPASSPVVLGIAIAAVLLAVFASSEWAMGRFTTPSEQDVREIRTAVVHCLLLAYTVGAFRAVVLRSAITFRELCANFPGRHSADLHPPPTSVRTVLSVSIVGLAMGVLAPFLTADYPWTPSTWPPEVYWHRVLGLAICLWLSWLGYALVKESLALSRLAAGIERVDLFDLTGFAPLVRQGLLNALLGVGWISLASLFLLDPGQLPVVMLLV